tara:strand:+ start:5615 stop:5890 length:276 start_codon:yes stop_codon:yes gene_type:complete
MRSIKICKKCGSLERYNNGACKPCGQVKQRLRNRERRLQCHIDAEEQNKKNNELKELAINAGVAHYFSLTACINCENKIRYVCNGACINCN